MQVIDRKTKRVYRAPKRGKLFSLGSFRFHRGRPLGTCRGVAA